MNGYFIVDNVLINNEQSKQWSSIRQKFSVTPLTKELFMISYILINHLLNQNNASLLLSVTSVL